MLYHKFLSISIITLLMFLIVQSMFINVEQGKSFDPFGIVAVDGTAIQIFYEIDEKDIKIPQDREIIYREDFFVFLDVRDENERSIYFEMFEFETKTISVYNADTGEYTYQNKSGYTKSRGNFTLKMRSGENVWGDSRFALKKVDSSVWVNLLKEDTKTLIKVTYLDLNIDFYHRTDYSLVPVTKTRGETNIEMWFQIIFLTILIFISILVSSMVYFKVGNIWPRIKFELVALLLTWFGFALFFKTYLETESMGETARVISLIPPEAISIFIAVVMFFFVPGQFRPKKLGKALLLKLNIPYIDADQILENAKMGNVEAELPNLLKAPTSKRMTLYVYYDRNGIKRYCRDPDSYSDWISRLFFGGLKINNQNTLVIPDENGIDEIIVVLDWSETKKKVLKDQDIQFIYSALFIGIIVSAGVSFFFRNTAMLFFKFEYFIFVTIALFSFLVLFFLYERIMLQYDYKIEKCSRNILSAMYDATIIDKLDKTNQKLIHKVMSSHRALIFSPYENFGLWVTNYELDMFPQNVMDMFGQKDIDDYIRPKAEHKKHTKKSKIDELARLENLDELLENIH